MTGAPRTGRPDASVARAPPRGPSARAARPDGGACASSSWPSREQDTWGVLKDPSSASRLLGCAAAVASALLAFAAGEPAGLGPLAWVAMIPLMVAVLRERRAVWSWLYGLAF